MAKSVYKILLLYDDADIVAWRMKETVDEKTDLRCTAFYGIIYDNSLWEQ